MRFYYASKVVKCCSTNKLRSYIGSVYNGDWYNVISIRHRNGVTDGINFGLLMYSNIIDANDTIHYKKQNQDWTAERTLLDSSNYNNYTPTKTGGGASGTWGINISGNAASATKADTVDGYHASDLLSKIYPVGSIYMSMSATNPADLFGVGTWKRISQGRMLLGADDGTYKAGATGGEATHTLSVNEMPAHNHSGNTSRADLQGNLSNSNNDSITCSKSVGTSGIFSRGNGWGHFGGQTSGDNVTTSLHVDASHSHSLSINNTGGGAAHNNMPPYLVCYIWQRTA